MEIPLRNPKEMTVCASIGFASKKRRRCATCSVQKVTSRCQLVSVVAALPHSKQIKIRNFSVNEIKWLFCTLDPPKNVGRSNSTTVALLKV